MAVGSETSCHRLRGQRSYAGGHSNTVDVPVGEGTVPVDTGFIVFNTRNYPNLTALFAHLGVATKNTEMSFGASLDYGKFEYSGTDLNGILGQRLNALRPRFWRMIFGILTFYRNAAKIIDDPAYEGMTLGEYLTRHDYSESFINDHLLPMGAAIWSTTAAEMKAYPVQAFVRFFESHGLLSLNHRPQWRTVDGGSREYVKRLTAPYRDHIHFASVESIRRNASDVVVEDTNGDIKTFDQIVLATHADEALQLLSDSDHREQDLLGKWKYTPNRAVLHSDRH